MSIDFFADTDADRFVILPTIAVGIGQCECCGGKAFGIALLWGCWDLGVAIQIHA